MLKTQSVRSSYRESIKVLEADIKHANRLAASLPKNRSEDCIQMKLSYSPFAPLFLFVIQWLNYDCTDALTTYLGLLHIFIYKAYVDEMPNATSQERKATLEEFYSVIYPSLMQLSCNLIESEEPDKKSRWSDIEKKHTFDEDVDREDECGICMETRSNTVLPSCGHSMCISCLRDWKGRSESCPFCRGDLRRVKSRDLWVLTRESDTIDMITLAKENLRNFYLYIKNLPPALPDEPTEVFVYNYMI